MKTCLHCKHSYHGHYILGAVAIPAIRCGRPVSEPSLVTGEPTAHGGLAETQRYGKFLAKWRDLCGPEGRYFEAR